MRAAPPIFAAAMLAALLLVPAAAAQGFDTAGLAPDVAALADLTVQRCASCHVLRRVLQARHVGEEWAPVVEKMRKKEKAGISAAEAETISKFLAAWSTRGETPAAAAPAPPAGTAPVSPAALAAVHRAVAGSTAIPSGAAFPCHVDLGVAGPVRVLSVALPSAGITVAQVEAGGAVHELRHDPASGGGAAATLRSWAIGPHRFRLEIALDATLPAGPAAPDAPGSLAIRSLVVRE